MWFKKRRTIDTVFFDIGGVIIDAPMDQYKVLGAHVFECSEQDLMEAASKLVPELETGSISSDDFWRQMGDELSAKGVGKRIPSWRFKGFWEGILRDTMVFHQDRIKLVKQLKGRSVVAALSNVIQEHAVYLKKEGIYDPFNPVLLSCQVGLRKPDPRIFAKAARMTNTDVERCLLIDDMIENVEAARKAGFQAHHYTNQDVLRRELEHLELLG